MNQKVIEKQDIDSILQIKSDIESIIMEIADVESKLIYLQFTKDTIKSKYIELLNKENDLYIKIKEKYGEGKIDLEKGLIYK